MHQAPGAGSCEGYGLPPQDPTHVRQGPSCAAIKRIRTRRPRSCDLLLLLIEQVKAHVDVIGGVTASEI